jgi:septum formation protein
VSAQRVVLASGSDVRRRLLAGAGLVFVVDPADVDESAREGEGPVELARRLSREKALEGARRHPGDLVIGSDQTGVTDDGAELRKCWDEAAAVEQLLAMAGRAHTFTSAAALARDDEVLCEVEQSATVRFRDFDEAEARAYAALGEWPGSAGSYHLEGRGAWLIESLEGSEHAVYGLPLLPLLAELRRQGVRGFAGAAG